MVDLVAPVNRGYIMIELLDFRGGKTTINTSKFPNMETMVDIKNITGIDITTFICYFESNDDLFNLMFLKKHFDYMGITDIHLAMYYFPYSRMDRYNNAYAFSLRGVCDFINSLNFKTVTIMEPHSDVVVSLIDRVRVLDYHSTSLHNVKQHIGFDKELDFLMFPDAGAQKRYAAFGDHNICVGNKVRDFKTGDIVSYNITNLSNSTLEGKKVIIMDDLCSKGGTFVGAYEVLKHTHNVDKVYLSVAHLETNVFNGVALDLLDGIFTSDSIIRADHTKIHTFKY